MKKPLKILHLEDLPEDVEMVARALKKAGVECEIFFTDSRDEFIKALLEFSPDIILSDHSLPSFDSHEALKTVKGMSINIPFILVTATVSEEYAVSIIREGASDYILKDRLQRLPNAISAALDKYDLEQARRRADETLRASERKYKLLFESNPLPMWMVSKSTLDIIAVNEAAIIHYGYSRDEFLTMNARNLRPPEDIDKYVSYVTEKKEGMHNSAIWRHKKKNGTIIMMDIIAHDVLYENNPARLVLANDVTEKLKAEAELADQQNLQQKLITEISIQVQEREREEIGKELHDNISQILATAKLYLEHAMQKHDLHSELLEKSQEYITLAIEESRKLSHTLIAPSLGEITLLESIRDLIGDIHFTTPLRLELSTSNYNEDAINKDIKLMFYRIVQEQINNIIKHSRAKQASIKLGATPGHILLTIKDDGIGFDSSKNSAGIGLRNISNRARFYDGTIRIISAPGEGCSLEVKIPAENAG